MENTRRKLRNANTCIEIENIFRNKTGNPEIMALLPPSLLKRVANYQKLSCNTVLQLPELSIQEPSLTELERVIQAQESQKLWSAEMLKNGPVHCEKIPKIPDVKEQHEDSAYYCMEPFLKERKRSTHEEMEDEEEGRKKQIWKDSSFLQNLNEFLMLNQNNGRAMFTPDYFMQK